jgi:hypothetical protein
VLVRLGGRPTGKVAARTVEEKPQKENHRFEAPCSTEKPVDVIIDRYDPASAIVPVASGTARTCCICGHASAAVRYRTDDLSEDAIKEVWISFRESSRGSVKFPVSAGYRVVKDATRGFQQLFVRLSTENVVGECRGKDNFRRID